VAMSFNNQAEKDVHKYNTTKGKLDSIGRGMCLAKWMQVTIHLQNGHTHSCHHPRTHKIPLEEIKENPSALHNTWYKKHARKQMLTDERPSECDYCWNVEDNSDVFSDRILKSGEPWAEPMWKNMSKNINGKNYLLDWRENVNPTYVEVVFSSACNFKCSYCAPHISTQWMQEIKKHGGYPTTSKFNSLKVLDELNLTPIPKDEPNPYVEAFWEWWPELYKGLHTFRITGGEPLLSRDTFKVLDYIIETDKPNKNLVLSVNTNMGAPDELMDKFIEKVKIITEKGLVKDFQIFTSIDGWGKKAEYIRHGLDYRKFWKNCERTLRELKKPSLTFMVTYNALSVFNFNLFIEELVKLKERFVSKDRYTPNSVVADISYLRHPAHQSVQILPNEFKELIKNQVELMRQIQEKGFERFSGDVFSHMEMEKLQRIYDWSKSKVSSKKLNNDRHDFFKFFLNHDKRRGTNILGVFPELKKFWKECSKIKVK
jgi:organic radical activating enzyme